MAFTDTSAIIARNFRVSFNDVVVDGLTSLSNFGTGGTAQDIPISTLDSITQEFAQGRVDGGSMSVQAIIDPVSPVYQTLLDYNKSGDSAELRILMGSVADGENQTSGKGWVTASNVPCTVAAGTGSDAGSVIFTVTKANAGRIPATKVGHYVRYGGTPTDKAITSIERVATGSDAGNVKIKVTLATAPSVTSLSFVRPSVEFRRQARVMEWSHQADQDSPLTLNITFRFTGDGIFNKGAPDITV